MPATPTPLTYHLGGEPVLASVLAEPERLQLKPINVGGKAAAIKDLEHNLKRASGRNKNVLCCRNVVTSSP